MQTIYDDTTHANENTLADMSAISLSLSLSFSCSLSHSSHTFRLMKTLRRVAGIKDSPYDIKTILKRSEPKRLADTRRCIMY
jgi:hypothetical protein